MLRLYLVPWAKNTLLAGTSSAMQEELADLPEEDCMSISQLRDAVRAAVWTEQQSSPPPPQEQQLQQQADNKTDDAITAVLLPHNGHSGHQQQNQQPLQQRQQRHTAVILTTCNLDVRACAILLLLACPDEAGSCPGCLATSQPHDGLTDKAT